MTKRLLERGRVYRLGKNYYVACLLGADDVAEEDFIEYIALVDSPAATVEDGRKSECILIVDETGTLCEPLTLAPGEEAEHPILDDYHFALLRLEITVDNLVPVIGPRLSYADALLEECEGDGFVDMTTWGKFFNEVLA